jgi:hypothetical protein
MIHEKVLVSCRENKKADFHAFGFFIPFRLSRAVFVERKICITPPLKKIES